ncbi:MAG: SDR family NAD(P)-dependent oxidoreductase [Alphaproteobacteria bacterium GM7ARS4]|nr:SDR family NAD(P)-dependent oxidoreductase [Alphaproteobacteria bacterium GM7ARS4]
MGAVRPHDTGEGRIALVVGASRGLGREIALYLASHAMHVLLLGRDKKALEEVHDTICATDGRSSIVVLDIRDAGGMAMMVETMAKRFGRLHLFIANAAYHPPLMPLDQASPSDWQETIAINVTAYWHFIKALTPLLVASKDAHALFMTCREAMSLPYWGLLALSKAALERMAYGWALEHMRDGLNINVFDPGAMRTQNRTRCGASMRCAVEPHAVMARLTSLLTAGQSLHGTFHDVSGRVRCVLPHDMGDVQR